MKRYRISWRAVIALCAFFAFLGCNTGLTGGEKKAAGGEKKVRVLYTSNGDGEFEKCG
jgi:hypothetical protein